MLSFDRVSFVWLTLKSGEEGFRRRPRELLNAEGLAYVTRLVCVDPGELRSSADMITSTKLAEGDVWVAPDSARSPPSVVKFGEELISPCEYNQ